MHCTLCTEALEQMETGIGLAASTIGGVAGAQRLLLWLLSLVGLVTAFLVELLALGMGSDCAGGNSLQ